jgi:peptidoglycan hydrolase-like protein with peptidoglycan-binding domain
VGKAPRPRKIVAVAAVVLAALVALAIVLSQSSGSTHRNAGLGVPAGETTAQVTRRTLTESSTVDGTLGYGSPLELYDRLTGTFTWLPAVGAVIGRGETLFRVDDLPVVLMYGAVPAYRALKVGISEGPDVTELNENLIDLGYDPGRVINDDDRFGEATAAAVRRWQKAEGLAQTGEVGLGRVIFAPGARRVTQVHVSLGQDPPGGNGAAQSPSSDTGSEKPAAERPASKAPSRAPTSKRPASRKPSANKPSANKPSANKPSANGPPSGGRPSEPAHEEPRSKKPASGRPAPGEPSAKDPGSQDSPPNGEHDGGAGAGTLVLTTTSTQQIVQVKVKAEEQQLAHVGEVAPVALPGGETVQGRITAVGTVAESKENEKSPGGEKGGSGGGESPTISVTLALDHRVARLDKAPVSVELV